MSELLGKGRVMACSELLWGVLAFAVGVALNTALLVFVLVKLPADYFQGPSVPSLWQNRPTTVRWIGRIIKNAAAILLILVGVFVSLPGVPGQGLLTILVGVILLDCPSKRRLERNLVSRPSMIRTINRLRARFGKAPLLLNDGRRIASRERSPGEPKARWHAIPLEKVFAHLRSMPAGLDNEEAVDRLKCFGPNEVQAAEDSNFLKILLRQLKSALILILLVAIAIAASLGHSIEALTITVIVAFSVFLGFVHEYRAERGVQALREIAAPTANVLRAGQEKHIRARELVPGDVVLLQSGDRIPADVRLIEAFNLRIEEAVLTGESSASAKRANDLLAEDRLPLAERTNMAFAGTMATYGRGRGIVVATGNKTEFGRIAGMLKTIETGITPLQESLDSLGRTLARSAFVLVLLIVGIGVLRGQPFLEMVILGIALAVAVVPEALPAVVTISLALGVRRMVKRRVLIRRLPAVETLGSVSMICSDKTGTLTQGEMTVRRLVVAGETFEIRGTGYDPHGQFELDGAIVEPSPALKRLLQAAALASDASIDESGARRQVHGDPTEVALIVAAAKAGLNTADINARLPRVDEFPFTSESKRMTTLHRSPEGFMACSKGAPEVILDSCAIQLTSYGDIALQENSRNTILATSHEMASQALRVLAVAEKSNAQRDNAEFDMTFLGLVGMIDPPRPEARAAIQTCGRAGIKPVMITGDHPQTARAIARELGVLKTGRVVTGVELEAMGETEFERVLEDIDVFARVSPADKLRIVTALQERGHVVAMTGDGVNDAPALKKADVGIAMGVTGTDVSREAAAMTLLDDNFASIVAAVEEGRVVFENIKKYLMYLISSNLGEIGLMAGASLLGMPLPLTAAQILYVNLATDGLPALALAIDPPDTDLMSRLPRKPRSGIFTRPVIHLTVVGGLWSTVVNLGLFAWALNTGRSLAESMTMTFASLVLIQFFKAYNFRSDQKSALNRPLANPWLNAAIFWELLLLIMIVHVPFLHSAFGTFSLTPGDWLVVVILAATVSPLLELSKLFQRRRGLDEGRRSLREDTATRGS